MSVCAVGDTLSGGRWTSCARRACGQHAACLDGSKRGRPAIFWPANCSMRHAKLSKSLIGRRIMFVGDSLMQYQFDALLAWLRRAGLPMRCQPVPEHTSLHHSEGPPRMQPKYAAIRELMHVAKYEGQPIDCVRPGLRLMSRRLNLLPLPADSLAHQLDELFSPLGGSSDGSVVLLNVGLHYGPLARHRAFASSSDALADSLTLLQEGVAALAQTACERGARWPRILWREHLPQHFASNGGEYRALRSSSSTTSSSATLRALQEVSAEEQALRRQARRSSRNVSSRRPGCAPLTHAAARRMHTHLSHPALEALASASGASAEQCRGDLSLACAAQARCTHRIEALRAFWPLVERFADHAEWRGRAAGRRTPDCTHFLPCSGAMMFLNRLLVDAIGAMPPAPSAALIADAERNARGRLKSGSKARPRSGKRHKRGTTQKAF